MLRSWLLDDASDPASWSAELEGISKRERTLTQAESAAKEQGGVFLSPPSFALDSMSCVPIHGQFISNKAAQSLEE